MRFASERRRIGAPQQSHRTNDGRAERRRPVRPSKTNSGGDLPKAVAGKEPMVYVAPKNWSGKFDREQVRRALGHSQE